MATMLAFSVGLAIPYLGTSVAITPILGMLSRHTRLARSVVSGAGVTLALLGTVMIGGGFTRLVEISSRILPWNPTVGM